MTTLIFRNLPDHAAILGLIAGMRSAEPVYKIIESKAGSKRLVVVSILNSFFNAMVGSENGGTSASSAENITGSLDKINAIAAFFYQIYPEVKWR